MNKSTNSFLIGIIIFFPAAKNVVFSLHWRESNAESVLILITLHNSMLDIPKEYDLQHKSIPFSSASKQSFLMHLFFFLTQHEAKGLQT